MRFATVWCLAAAWGLSACSALPSLPALSSLPIPNVFSVPPSPWPGTPVIPAAPVGSPPMVMAIPTGSVPPPTQGDPTKPYHALAVTRPPVANDFPVTYRVQVPSVDERVRLLPESIMNSETAVVSVRGAGAPAAPAAVVMKIQRSTQPARSQGPADDMSYVH